MTGAGDGVFQAKDVEGREGLVNLDELAQVADDDLAVDEVQATNDGMGQLFVESIVDGLLDGYLALQQLVEGLAGDMLGQLVVEGVGSLVEDVAEDAVVELLLIVGLVGLLDARNIAIVELQRTAHIFVDG